MAKANAIFRGLNSNVVAVSKADSFANGTAVSRKAVYLGGDATGTNVLKAKILSMKGKTALYNINLLGGDSISITSRNILHPNIGRASASNALGFGNHGIMVGGNTALHFCVKDHSLCAGLASINSLSLHKALGIRMHRNTALRRNSRFRL